MTIEQVWGSVYRPDFISSRYPNCVFGKLAGKYVAIVSDYPFDIATNSIVNVRETKNRQLYKVDMDMRMGKGFHPTELSLTSYRFTLVPETKIFNGVYYIYKIVG